MHYSGIDTTDPEEFMSALNVMRFAKLRRQIGYCFDNSDYYRAKLRDAGISAPGDVDSFDTFRALPALITKSEHRAIQDESMARDGHPYGTHLCAPLADVVHVAATSGTTGQPTFYTFTRRDLELTCTVFGRMWKLIGLRPGDTVLQANGLSMWLAGLTPILTLQAYGARTIPIGAEAGVARILRMMDMTRPVAMMCTPSLASHLIERAPDEIGKPVAALGLRKLIIGGEPGGGLKPVRERLSAAYGATIHDIAGAAWHNGLISDSEAEYSGMHVMGEDHCIRYDLRDPETHAPLPLVDGAVGEAIHTGLEYQAGPGLRYASGDIVRLHVGTAPSGIFGTRMEIVGRADDLLIVKGVKVYPASLQAIIDAFHPHTTGAFRIELDTPPPRVTPPLRLTVEAGVAVSAGEREAVGTRIAARMHAVLAVRPVIEMVPPGAIPRSSLKTRLIHVRDPSDPAPRP